MLNKLKELQKRSYAPYSNFRVAAILVANDGVEYKGVNIESASYSPTNCAERSALFSAISQGAQPRSFKEIHIIGGDLEEPVSPCGVCRQVISELMGMNAIIIQYGINGKIRKNTIKELLPFAFEPEHLK